MSVYVSIMEGDSPESIRPILTTRDPKILRAVSRAIERRIQGGLDPGAPAMRRGLDLVRSEAKEDAGDP